jgi:hypothetical protein
MASRFDADSFTLAYADCMLWAETDADGEALDIRYDINDFSDEAWQTIVDDCAEFQATNAELLNAACYTDWFHPGDDTEKPKGWTRDWDYPIESAGHDYWLTRNGHGAGFWDRGIGELGDKLTIAAKSNGSRDIYIGDDNKLHIA